VAAVAVDGRSSAVFEPAHQRVEHPHRVGVFVLELLILGVASTLVLGREVDRQVEHEDVLVSTGKRASVTDASVLSAVGASRW
jgi:hypothetical protein